MLKRLYLSIVLALFLVSCGQSTPTPAPTATWTSVPNAAPSASPVSPTATTALATGTATTAPTATAAIPTDTPAPTATLAPVVYGPDNFPAGVDPLTGLVVANPALLERRPIAFKVNLVPRDFYRPPFGLSLADIVYDYYHNAGYSRLHAIFYGNDADLVGPIRSGRLPDNELIRMYKSIFAYGSADQVINNRFFNAEYANRLILEGGSVPCPPTPKTPLCRYEPAGHDHLLGGTAAISQHITNLGVENGRQNLNGMTFMDVAPSGGVAGTQVFTRFSGDDYSRWDYDPSTGKYLRFQDKVYDQGQGEQYEPLLDRQTNQQISAANVVVLIAPHVYFQPPPNEIVEILLSGQGKAYAFRDGKEYEVTWNRPTVDSVLFLTFPDGSRYSFKPGITWFEIVSDKSPVKKPSSDVWRFEFKM